MKKIIKTEGIENDLKNSAFFRRQAPAQAIDPNPPAVPRPKKPDPEVAAPEPSKPQEGQPVERTTVPPPERPFARTTVRRVLTRYSFEFFRDQIDSLREFSLEEKLRGEKGNMSEMVREGIDTYIAKRRNRDET